MKKYFCFLFISFLFFSCSKKSDVILFESDEHINLNPMISWAVVTEPYAGFRKNPSWTSSVNDHCRLGDVLMIEGTAILDSQINSSSKEIWYRFDRGWLSESSISVYQNKLKAQKVASTLTK